MPGDVEPGALALVPPAEASTFSSTVNQGNNAKLWKTMPIFGAQLSRGWPCTSTMPREGAVNPDRILSKVDFPDPEGPRRAKMVSDSMDRSIGAMI